MPRFIQTDGKVHAIAFGCRRDDGRWLMVRRGKHLAMFPNAVCFPGGGVEAGESQPHACIREAREELGIAIRPIRPVWRHEFPDQFMILFGWLADREPGPIAPDPSEIAEVLWLSRDEALVHPDSLPTNRSFIAALEST